MTLVSISYFRITNAMELFLQKLIIGYRLSVHFSPHLWISVEIIELVQCAYPCMVLVFPLSLCLFNYTNCALGSDISLSLFNYGHSM
jgi:hypothetical protein